VQESPIFVRSYDLLKWLLQATEHFPRGQRFVMAQRLQAVAFDFQDALVAAGRGSGDTRRRSLDAADYHLARLRLYLRLSLDMRWLSMGQYEHVSRMVDEIGRLLGGWQRKERESASPS